MSINRTRFAKAAARKEQRGWTLIDVAMALAIVALIVAGVMVYFNNASMGSKTNATLTQLGALQNAIRQVYAGQADYNGLSSTDLINTRAIPTKMYTGTTIKNPFGGDVVIAAANVGAGTNNGFTIQFSQIPAEACSKIATMDLGTGLSNLQIGSTNFTQPPTPSDAATACGTGNTTAVMTWTFF